MSKKAAEHHKKASEHHSHAAHHHGEAAKHHESGQHEKAAHHAHTARGSNVCPSVETLAYCLIAISPLFLSVIFVKWKCPSDGGFWLERYSQVIQASFDLRFR
jgi:hypothetical protein